MPIENPSLSEHDYQLLPLATSQSVNNNRKFNVSDIFLKCFTHCWWRGPYIH